MLPGLQKLRTVAAPIGTHSPKSTIVVNGVDISTDWKHWTPLTLKEFTKLELTPPSGTNYGYPYKGLPLESPFSGMRFWVKLAHSGAAGRTGVVDWYVLAAKSGSLYTYEKDQEPYFIHEGRKHYESEFDD